MVCKSKKLLLRIQKTNYETVIYYDITNLTISLFSCHKDTLKPNTPKYFPNTVGDFWDYDVTDSAHSTPNNPSTPHRYSLKVSITGTKRLLDGNGATVWQYKYFWINDTINVTNYIRIVGDTIKIFDRTDNMTLESLNYPGLIFLKPFEVNKRWDGKHLGVDTLTVLSQADITTTSGTFSDCFDIYRHYLGPNMELNDHYWFKPYVGFISLYYIHYINAPITYRTMQLKTYFVH